MVGEAQSVRDTEKFLADGKKLHGLIAALARLSLRPVASGTKIAALLRQQSAPLQVGALLQRESVQPYVAAAFVGPDASAQSLLHPGRAETESGRAAFRGGAALRLNEFYRLA